MTHHSLRRLGAVTAGAVIAAAAAGSADAARHASRAQPTVKPRQELAVMLAAQTALSRPSARSAPVTFVPARRPITEIRTTLPVLAHRTGPRGVRWLRVSLPGRPNGRTGWIRKARTRVAVTTAHVVVDTSARRATVYQRGRATRTFRTIMGRPSTPTPLGRFFVEEVVALRAGDVGAPYALALSARSRVFQTFAGGPGQIALHGLGNVGGRLGTAVSHGCVRLDNGAMRWLVTRIPPGTPVTVTA